MLAQAAMDSLRMDNPFTLSPLERDMLVVAKRTAEYFDSLDKVRAEARRIAHMIRASTYVVAFTGQSTVLFVSFSSMLDSSDSRGYRIFPYGKILYPKIKPRVFPCRKTLYP